MSLKFETNHKNGIRGALPSILKEKSRVERLRVELEKEFPRGFFIGYLNEEGFLNIFNGGVNPTNRFNKLFNGLHLIAKAIYGGEKYHTGQIETEQPEAPTP